ncbi:MAG: hypothetical protein ACFE9I_02875 [Candidatus Hermodarchaeota archaeon]
MKEKVWYIRTYIQKFEYLKDDIVNHLNLLDDFDDSTKKLWIADVKELYYNIIPAWEFLIHSKKIENKSINNSKTFLYIARNGLSKVISELNILKVHNFLKKYHTHEGLDAYCPEYNKIYCWEHYNAREEFDDGFYDYTYGECPEGHKRMIDD